MTQNHGIESFNELAAESNHRIANHLAMLASMVQLQGAAVMRGPAILGKAEVCALLNELGGKIVGISHLHRMLADSPLGTSIDLGKYLAESSGLVVSSLGAAARARIEQSADHGCFVSPQQAQSVALIANEVLINAIKHAHPTGIAVQIRLACERVASDHLAVEIEDDGIGLPEQFDAAKDGGMGFALIRSLAASLGAEMTIRSDSLGTCFRFVLDCAEHGLATTADQADPAAVNGR